MGQQLGEHAALAHASRDQLRVLASEVKDQNLVGRGRARLGGRLSGGRLRAHSTRAGSRRHAVRLGVRHRGRGGAHADPLLLLELLALRLERRRHHHLGLVERRDVLVATGGHRGAEAAHEVERAVVLVGRPEQDLLERAVLRGLHARAARERRVEGGHAPVVAAARRLIGAGERGADHHGIGAAGEGLRDVAAVAHSAVGDHLHVLTGLEHVLRAGRRHVRDRGGLRHADAEHAARGAGRAGANAHQHRLRPGPHQVQPGGVRGAPADDHRHRHLADELLQVERLGAGRDVLGRDDGALDHEDVEAGLERALVVLTDALRRERGRGDDAVLLDLPDPLRDQVLLDRLRVDALHLRGGELLGHLGDPLELRVGILVAGPDSLEVQDAEAAELAEYPGGVGGYDSVHGRGEQGQLEPVRADHRRDVDVVRIARAPRGHDGDVIEAICAAALLAAPNLNFHSRILGSTADEQRAYQRQPTVNAGVSSCSTRTSGARRSTSRCSTTPAPKCWVDSAPQATAKRRHSSTPRPA